MFKKVSAMSVKLHFWHSLLSMLIIAKFVSRSWFMDVLFTVYILNFGAPFTWRPGATAPPCPPLGMPLRKRFMQPLLEIVSRVHPRGNNIQMGERKFLNYSN